MRLSGLPGSFDQSTTFLFGSASITVTAAPRSASSVARIVAAVVFPAPPFGELSVMTGMSPLLESMWLPDSYLVPDKLTTLLTGSYQDTNRISGSYWIA